MPFDFKKEYKELYMPKQKPTIVDVPKANYIAVRGTGNPNEEDGDYQYVYEKVAPHFKKENIIINTAGGTICAHCGPRTLGILYLLK